MNNDLLPVAKFSPKKIEANIFKELMTYVSYILTDYEKGFTDLTFSSERKVGRSREEDTLILKIEQKRKCSSCK